MASCPHCSEAIPGFVTRETLKEQLAAKDAATALLSTELTKARTDLEAVADIRAAHQEATAKIAKMERTALLSSRGITDPTVIETMEIIHAAKNAGADEPVAFEDFEGWGATSNPLLAALFREQSDAPPPATPPAPPRLPTNDLAAQDPPPRQGRPTPAQVAARLNSPEFAAMPRAEQEAEIAVLKQQVGA